MRKKTENSMDDPFSYEPKKTWYGFHKESPEEDNPRKILTPLEYFLHEIFVFSLILPFGFLNILFPNVNYISVLTTQWSSSFPFMSDTAREEKPTNETWKCLMLCCGH